MKNKLLLFLVIILLVALPNLSFAETGASTTNAEKKTTIKDELDAKKESIRNSVEERRQGVVDKIKERVDQFVQTITERFDAAESRLETLTIRIESRITKIEARDIDTSEAKDLFVIAKDKIKKAEASIANITLPTNNTSPLTTVITIKEAFEATKIRIETAKKDLKDAHAALVDVVNNLKPGDNKLKSAETND